VEAAAYRGRIVSFRIVEPWTKPTLTGGTWAQPSNVVSGADWAVGIHVGANFLLILFPAWLAWSNLQAGRGDRKGAFRLALYFLAVQMLHWLFGAHHVASQAELQVVYGGLYRALFHFGLVWILYMALEPYARRMWPKTMISWVRLLNGRFRDSLVGRDILAGSIGGMVVGFGAPIYKLAPGWLGYALPRPDRPSPDPGELVSILGLREALSQLFLKHANVLVTALFVLAALVVLRLVL